MANLRFGGLVRMALCAGALAACGASDDDSAGNGTGGAGGTGETGGTGGAPVEYIYVASILGPPFGGCLPRPLELDADNLFGNETQTCAVIESHRAAGATCSCDTAHGRIALEGLHAGYGASITEQMRNSAECDQAGTPACTDYCHCEIAQLTGDALLTCESSLTDPGTVFGVCYVDPSVDVDHDGTPDANPDLLASCEDTQKRELRFMGADTPAPDALVFLGCSNRHVK